MKKNSWIPIGFAILLAGCFPTEAVHSTPLSQLSTSVNTPMVLPSPTQPPTPTNTPTPLPTNTSTPTPLFPKAGSVINPANVAQLAFQDNWGNGKIDSSAYMGNEQFIAIRTSSGVYVYSATGSQMVAAWPGAQQFAVSPDSHILAVAYGKGNILIWNSSTKTTYAIHQERDADGMKHWLRSSKDPFADQSGWNPDLIVFSQNNQWLALSSADGRVGVYNTTDGSQKALMQDAQTGPSEKTAISDDGHYVVTIFSGNVDVWDTVAGKLLFHELQVYTANMNFLPIADRPFSPDSSMLITMTNGGRIDVWGVPDGQKLFSLSMDLDTTELIDKTLYNPVVRFSEDGKYIILKGMVIVWCNMNGNTVKCGKDWRETWRISDQNKVTNDTVSEPPSSNPAPDIAGWNTGDFATRVISGMSLLSSTNLLAWGGTVESAWLWKVLQTHMEPIKLPDQCLHVPGGITLFHIENGFSLPVAYSPDCSIKIDTFKMALVMRTASDNSILHMMNAHSRIPSMIIFSPTGKYFASGSTVNTPWDFGEIMLWTTDPAYRKWTQMQGGACTFLAFSPDETLLASIGIDPNGSAVHIWRTSDSVQLKVIHPSGIYTGFAEPYNTYSLPAATATAFSPDNQIIAIANSRFISFYSLSDGKIINTIRILPGGDSSTAISSLSFTPDGTGLLIGTNDGVLELWGIPTL
jgi:WD40 repeat protein